MRSILLLMVIGIIGCEDDDDNTPDPVNQEELITTVKLVFSPMGNIDDAIFVFRDTDGEGGENPTILTDTLFTNTTYDITVHFLNESLTPVDSVNDEIIEEGEEHQVFLQFDPPLGISQSYTDADINTNPVGIQMQILTDSAGTTDMKLILRHEPDKSAQGVFDGDITNAGGETDVEVNFEVRIE